MTSKSFRKCEITTRIDYLPGYPDAWKETLIHNLENHPNITTWAFILHDKDTDKDGNLVAPHVHIPLELAESVKDSTIGGYVGVAPQFVERIKQRKGIGKRSVADIGGSLSYLTHRNAPNKYQYSDDDVVAKPGYDWQSVRDESEKNHSMQNSLKKVFDGIESGEIRPYNLTDVVSMQTYIDYSRDFEKAFEFRRNKIKNTVSRSLDVIYITGDAGAGKTTLAKKICNEREYSYCLSGSSRDPLQDYNGQDALILDDLRPTVFPLSDLLKILDNHTSSSASARYHDRWLEVKLIIVTTVLSIDDFFYAVPANDEPIQQLKRRCQTMIRITKTDLLIYSFNAHSQDYILIGSGSNPVADMYNTKDAMPNADSQRKLCDSLGVEYKPDSLPSDYLL